MGDRGAGALRHGCGRFIGFACASADLRLELTGALRVSWAAAAAAFSFLTLDFDRAIARPLGMSVLPLAAPWIGAWPVAD